MGPLKASADNRLHLYLPSYTLAAMLLCLYENSPVLSAPVKAWNTGHAFALSAPMALHIGSILPSPEAIEIDVFFRMSSQFAMTNTKTVRHLCLGRRKPFVHPVGFTVMPGQRGRSTVRVLPRDYCPGRARRRCRWYALKKRR